MFSRNDILYYLQSNKDFFYTRFKIIRIGIFGSFARNEQNEASDIDFIVEFEEDTPDLFDKKFELKEHLKLHFNKEIDICREGAIKPLFRPLIMNEVIYA